VIPPGGGDLAGRLGTTRVEDQETLLKVARQYDLGYEEMRLANSQVDFWLLEPGTEVILPNLHILPVARREGIVLNVPEMRLYYFPIPCTREKQCMVITHPVSIGRMDWHTPLGTTHVTRKVKDPTWTPPESIRKEAAANGKEYPEVMPAGPDNPMGAYAIYLALEGYRIHGTNRSSGIGLRATHGCIRLYPEDIESLFERVDVGTEVQIVSQPIKFGWDGDTLYMEVHPPLEEDEDTRARMTDIALDLLEPIALERSFTLDSHQFRRGLEEMNGIPVAISHNAAHKKNRASASRPDRSNSKPGS
jgi:L,D-transpeptidase ErfK/SrfK